MVKVQAWEKLNDSSYCNSLNADSFYRLLIKAGYKEEVAQKGATERGWQRMLAGMEV